MGIVGNDVTTVQQTCSHVLAVTGVTLDHLVVRLEARHGNFLDRVGLVSSLGSRDDGSIGNKREMNTRVGHQVGLELVQINVERAIESERRGDGGDDYSSKGKRRVSCYRHEVLGINMQEHMFRS